MILTLAALSACVSPSIPTRRAGDSHTRDSADTGLPTVPPDSGDSTDSTDSVDSSDTSPSTWTAPGRATLDCPAEPTADGKIDCTLHIEDQAGNVQWDGPAGVSLHGRSSLDFPKQQFSIELRDAADDDAPADLFGMGEEADWLLNGMYIDRALFRNKLCFDLYRDLTADREWAPESVYVELLYQGEYYGVYQLEERIDHSRYRAQVPDDDGTGSSFIAKGDESGFPSALQYAHWALNYPAESAQTPEVLAGVQARLRAMETAIAATDAATWDQVDLDSAVAFVLMEEFIKNNDAYFLSNHIYTGMDGRIRFTPWDVDLSFGQPDYNDNENPESWIAYRSQLIIDLAAAPGFRERMSSMWAEWRAGALSDATIDGWLEANPTLLGSAIDRNFARWPIEDIQFGGTLYAVTSYEDELAHVSPFVHARLAWMDANVAAY